MDKNYCEHNVVYGETDGDLTAEWADRAIDDADRYSDDTIFIRVAVPKDAGRAALDAALDSAFKRWVKGRTQ